MKKLRIKRIMNISIYGLLLITFIIVGIYGFGLYLPIYNSYKTESQNILNQFKDNLELVLKNTIRIGDAISYDRYIQKMMMLDSVQEKYEYASEIDRLTDALIQSDENISTIITKDNDGKISTLYSLQNFDDYIVLNKILDIYQNRINIIGNNNKYYCCYARPVFDINDNISKKIGDVFVLCELESVQNLIDNIQFAKRSVLTVVDQNDIVILSNKNDLIGTKLDNNANVYQFEVLDRMGIKIAYRLIEPFYVSNIKVILLYTFIVCIVFFIFVLFINSSYKISIVNPLRELYVDLEGIGQSNLSKRINLQSNPDLDVIVKGINEMLDRIEIMTHTIVNNHERLYEMELLNQKTSFLMLQNQVNPHFLYNTLECIRGIAITYGVKEIADIALAMSKIFRYTIQGSERDTLRKEISVIHDYMTIINTRFPNKIKTIVDISENLYDKVYIKMILQPIVENAILHGIAKIDGEGILKITAQQCETGVLFTVSDSGRGIEQNKLNEINDTLKSGVESGDHLGLYNVNSRIKLYYGNDFGISIDSVYGEGTEVKINLPLNCNGGVL